MALKFSLSLLLILSIQTLNAQSFSFHWENEQAVSISFSALGFEGIKLQGNNNYLMGKVEESDTITFTPLIPFASNRIYQVWADGRQLFEFSPEKELRKPQLLTIYPQRAEVPANFLKFYIAFDTPMGEVNPYQKINMYKGGEKIEHAILLLNPPLWNEDHTILTVWLEPGRIKTGLGPNQKRGVILKPNDTVIILVDAFRARNGLLIQNDFRKELVVSARDENKPEIKAWKMTLPQIESREKLLIKASEAMDYRSTVEGSTILLGDDIFPGFFRYENDSTFSFSPQLPWREGEYILRIDSKAEDLAGNNFNKLFEEKVTESLKNNGSEYQYLDFKIEKSADK